MSKALSKCEIAYELGKVYIHLMKVQKLLDELDITSLEIDKSLNTLMHICEEELNALKDRSS